MARALDVIVPVFNEAGSIDEFYGRMERLGLADALLFVDNGSTDGTLERLARYPKVRVIRHAANQGYGASLRDGLMAAEGDRMVIIDADLEYPPEAIPAVLGALERAPVVYCSRFLAAGQPPSMAALRRIGNALMSRLYNLLFRQRVTDLYTGMKGFRRGAIGFHALRRPGFEHCVEIAALIAVAGHRIAEIPIEYAPRRRGRSKMRHVPEALKVVAFLGAYWVRRGVLRRRLTAPPRHGRDASCA